jgi:gliding motility-associated-like protein
VILANSLFSQEISITKGQGKVYKKVENRIDAIVMMKDLSVASEISVDARGLSVEWYEFYNKTSIPQFHSSPEFVSNQNFINPDDHSGYIVKLSGIENGEPYSEEISLFVINYSIYLPTDIQLVANNTSQLACSQVELEIMGHLPDMNYATSNGLVYPLKRELTLEYETLEWKEQWVTQLVELNITPVNGKIELMNSPLKDTYFTLKGDQFARDLGIGSYSFRSSLYAARRVECKITTEATLRTEKHEVDRPEQLTTVSGSAPLEILFKSNGNEPVANYYNWTITAGDELLLSRTDATHTYTFSKAGTFLVKVRAENAFCSYTDSLTIKVSESAINAPNVFSPNGDGINDEFRVAYKSIIEFQCIIYNRWGSKIFEWNDIQKGWDGTLNGKPVHEGAYFYVIRARGSDDKVYNLKGDINLLRGKK